MNTDRLIKEFSMDPDIESIKKITRSLKSSLEIGITTHKKRLTDFIEISNSLDRLMREYKTEADEIKYIAYSAYEQSCQTFSELKKLKESVVSKTSRVSTDNINERKSINDAELAVILKGMKDQINDMNGRLIENEQIIERKEKQNMELREIIEKEYNFSRNSTITSIGCGSCIIN